MTSNTTTPSPSLIIRPFRAGDEPALSLICCRTGLSGADASGVLSNDALWGDVYVLPYVARDPGLAWVVVAKEGSSGGIDIEADIDADAEDEGEVVGYLVGTDDTTAFDAWFRDTWWPSRRGLYPLPPSSTDTDTDTDIKTDMAPHADSRRDPTRERKVILGAESKGHPGPSSPNAPPLKDSHGNPIDLTTRLSRFPAHMHIDLLPLAQGRGLGKRMIPLLLDALRARGVRGLHLGAAADNAGACAFYEKVGFGEIPAEEGARVFVWDLSGEERREG